MIAPTGAIDAVRALAGEGTIAREVGGAARELGTLGEESRTLAHAAEAVVPAATSQSGFAIHSIDDMARLARTAHMPHAAPEPAWYQKATMYELNVRAFADSNGDGIGDLKGLTGKLDYIKDLGADAIWMLPINESPMRDGGYDVSNFLKVNEEFGSTADLKEMIDAAHQRGIKVIAEFPLNHTSDQHEWFQRARTAPKGSPERDFYVWSDTDAKYKHIPINFADFETSNWTFDDTAGEFYFHRWYSHQPDLNWDNPAVEAAMTKVVDHWFDLGVDGLRLDAAPYLIEREGTNGDSLPETLDIIKRLRAHVDANYSDRMLLAEANVAPPVLGKYFGTARGEGAGVHMAFNFPLMSNLFLGAAKEDARPIEQAIASMPKLPETGSMANFLRNHDELNVAPIVDPVDRQLVLDTYAPDAQSRVLGGIRKRVAPLMGNDPRQIEMMNAMLFSMPGTPVIYYGDEIGMGDNVLLADRDAVRTPMQWTADARRAGFSTADPSKFPKPLVSDATYGAAAVNVAAQQADPGSLLWRMKRVIATRKQHPVLATGAMQVVPTGSQKVLAFTRTSADERVLSITNLAATPQKVRLDPALFGGVPPRQLLGSDRIADVDIAQDGVITLPPKSFHWLGLAQPG